MNDDANQRFTWRVLLAFGLLYVIWGSTIAALRLGITNMPPALFAAFRLGIAGLLMLLVMWIAGQRLLAPEREMRSLAIVGFLLLVCGNGLVVWAQQYVAS